jgi:uridine monophosphate synthetase
MSRQPFFPMLAAEARRKDSHLCVGLDPGLDIPTPDVLPRMRAVVDAAGPFACAVKPNIAFYEARGPEGMEILARLISHAHDMGLPVILDAKRGDVSSTADAYAHACFEVLRADALTVNPLLGGDSVESFARHGEHGLFLLCHTSNPGARDLQELDTGGAPFYERIAEAAQGWNSRGNVGLVAGATFPEQLARVRAIAPDMWILLPGVGAQGGDLEASLAAGLDASGSGVLVNVSRAISQADDPGAAARGWRDRINAARSRRAAPGSSGAGSAAARARPDSLADRIALGLHDLGAVRFGEFTLKSGQKSPIYIDLRLLVSDPGLMRLAARAMAGLMTGLAYDRIAALPYGGLPIGQAVALETGKPLLYPRREVKDYGTRKSIEGKFEPGETVAVLDDLVTTGGSKLEALAPLTEAGLKVSDVVVLVDRDQGGRQELAGHGLTLHAVLGLGDILDSLVRHGRITEAENAHVRAALGLT